MNKLHLLVATLSMLPGAAWLVIATMKTKLSVGLNNLMSTPERVGNLMSILTNIAFIGGSVGVLMGLQENNDATLVFSTLWFLVFSGAADRLARHSAELRKRNDEESLRQNAIDVRLIIKRELADLKKVK